jgi:RecB family exonuclease
MQSFIQQLIQDILAGHPEGLSKVCLVFPTRRAGLFFKRELAKKTDKPIWAPGILGIQDLIQTLTPRQIPDNLSLLFELYQSYLKYLPGESFEKFYPWGQLLLKDYDEIDRYLVDAPKIFRNIQDLKDIDATFSMADEDIERIKDFWKTFSDRDLSTLKKEFLSTWEVLAKVYVDYKARLKAKDMLYEGLAYRLLAETKTEELLMHPFFKEYEHIVFAGFYALSTAEELIIQNLITNKKASIYWDADRYYMEDERQEAGRFLRKGKLIKPNFKWTGNYFEQPKTIEIIGVPLQVGQAKALGSALSDLLEKEKGSLENTAVVLPDENMLFPMLYSLPANLPAVNITMGYPLHYTPLYALFENIMNLHKNGRMKDGQPTAYYHRDVLNVVMHPYIQLIDGDGVRAWLKRYEAGQWIYIGAKHLENEKAPAFFKKIFTGLTSVAEAFPYFLELLHLIQQAMQAQDASNPSKNQYGARLESEYIYHFYTQLKRLQDIVKEHEILLSLNSFWSLFKEIIFSTKIPFTGEPLQGLQVMGFLETRVLDFENVFILSVNEGVLPAGGKQHSFIPYSLRKGYGLPTFEEQDAIYAFHFYRLLQRAKNIQLYHNTEVKSLSAGEKSRYLLQIEYELKKKLGPKLNLVKKLISTDIQPHALFPVLVEKGEEVTKRLLRYFPKEGADSTYMPKFSATALSSYINCKLQFYFRYIAKLKELEEVEDYIEANTFGSILHKAMELVYLKKEPVTISFLEKAKQRAEEIVLQAIREVFPALDEGELEGKNLLLKQVIVALVKKILDNDKKELPFQILDLEKQIEIKLEITPAGHPNPKHVILNGYLDRVDLHEEDVRILDYKTGEVKLNDKGMEALFTLPDHKIAFQGYFYAWLYWKQNQASKIKVGIYPVVKLNEGIQYLNQGATLSESFLKEFELRLIKLLQEIFTKEKPFEQVAETDKCLYCAYTGICGR